MTEWIITWGGDVLSSMIFETRSVTGRWHGFSLLELLVALGVVAVVVSLVVPAMARVSGRAKLATSLSRIHQLHIGLEHYAGQFKDLPPTFGTPSLGRRDWVPSLPGLSHGTWFRQSQLFSLAMSALLEDTNVVVAKGNPSPEPIVELWGLPGRRGDFFLAQTCYASPAFFNWETQVGLTQFAPQPLSSVVFPSDKGLIYQWQVFHENGPGALACCVADVSTAVCFADGSASEEVMTQMIRGMVNLYDDSYNSPGIDPTVTPGYPIHGTHLGNRGRDR